jgi:hypothetical protein
MKNLIKLTSENQSKFKSYVNKYVRNSLDGSRYKNFSKENAEKLINWTYESAGFKKPIVLVCENPYESQLLYNFIIKNKKYFLPILYFNYCMINNMEQYEWGHEEIEYVDGLTSDYDISLKSKIISQLKFKMHEKLDGVIYPELINEMLYNKLSSFFFSKLNSHFENDMIVYNRKLLKSLTTKLYGSLLDGLENNITSNILRKIENQVIYDLKNKSEKYSDQLQYLYTSNLESNSRLSIYKFIKDELNVKTGIDQKIDLWDELYTDSNIYSTIVSELFCIVSKYPKKIHLDSNNNLHNMHGPAVEWGYSFEETKFICDYIENRHVNLELLKKIKKIKEKTLTFEEFMDIKNEEDKSLLISIMRNLHGDTYLYDFFTKVLKEVDTYVDKKEDKFMIGTTNSNNVGVYTLFMGVLERDIVNATYISFVRCYCPSTDRMFFLGVEPKYTNAKDAIASLYRIPKKLKNHIKYIQRQGERYSTVFDDEGTYMLKNNKLTKNDIQDTVTISGDEYFKKMRYEY